MRRWPGYRTAFVEGSALHSPRRRPPHSPRTARRRALMQGPFWLFSVVLAAAFAVVSAQPAMGQDSGGSTVRSISATEGWQESYVTLSAGQQFTVTYLSGSWTVDARSFPTVGPEGYSAQDDAAIYQDCKYDAGNTYGVLYGELVNGTTAGSAFPIGKGGTFTASSDGELYLRINDADHCLVDNAVSITLSIAGTPLPPPNNAAGKLQRTVADFGDWLNACVNDQSPDKGCSDAANDVAGTSKDPASAASCVKNLAKTIKNETELTYCLGAHAVGLYSAWQDQHPQNH